MVDASGIQLEDTQALIDRIRPGMSTEELIKLQLDISQATLVYTAVSAAAKTISDCESGIARNF